MPNQRKGYLANQLALLSNNEVIEALEMAGFEILKRHENGAVISRVDLRKYDEDDDLDEMHEFERNRGEIG